MSRRSPRTKDYAGWRTGSAAPALANRRLSRGPHRRMTNHRSPNHIPGVLLMSRLVAAAICVAFVSALSSVAADDKPITVELKSFTFDPANSELLGYQDEQGRLFYYINGAAEAAVKIPADGDYTIVINAACDP